MYTLIGGSQTEVPITPHAGLSYQATPDYLFYFSAAEGYRAGGINAPASLANCAVQLAQVGTTQTPLSYNSDKVWSYEVGGKLRSPFFVVPNVGEASPEKRPHAIQTAHR